VSKLVAGVVLVTILVVLACGGGNARSTGGGAPVPTASGGQNYPAEVRQDFMDSCTSTGGSGSQCQCLLAKLEAVYPLQEFIELERDLPSGSRTNELNPLIQACRSE
jgi:hypothetical protein